MILGSRASWEAKPAHGMRTRVYQRSQSSRSYFKYQGFFKNFIFIYICTYFVPKSLKVKDKKIVVSSVFTWIKYNYENLLSLLLIIIIPDWLPRPSSSGATPANK